MDDNRGKILYFTERFPSQSETWVHHEIRELRRNGYHVKVFSTLPRPTDIPQELLDFAEITTYLSDIPTRSMISFLPVIILKPRAIVALIGSFIFDTRGIRQKLQVIRDFIYIGRMFRQLSSFRPDVIYSHAAGTRANLALIYSLYTGVPFFIKMHAGDVFVRQALFGLKAKESSIIYTISDYNIKFMMNNYKDVDMSKVKKNNCGIPVDEYAFKPLTVCGNPPVVLAVGRLVPMKGFKYLIHASRIMKDRGFAHSTVIAGYGPQRSYLVNLIDELGVNDTVILAGYCTPDMIIDKLRKADVFVLPCVHDKDANMLDGIPVALMEAMACGVPVISTKVSGIPELVIDKTTGFLVAPENPDELAEKIMRVCVMSQHERDNIISNARKHVEENYNVDKMAHEIIKDIRRIMPEESLRL